MLYINDNLRRCSKPGRVSGNDLRLSLRHQFFCFDAGFNQCLANEMIPTGSKMKKNLLCGIIDTKQKLPRLWTIRVHSEFGISLEFCNFHLPPSRGCTKTWLKLLSPSLGKIFVYCGKRVPWDFSFRDHAVKLEYKHSENNINSNHFNLVYKALDFNVSATGLVQENYFRKYLLTFVYFTTQQPSQNILVKLHITVGVAKKSCIRLPKRRDPIIGPHDLKLYDGPGPLSPIHTIPNNKQFICVNSFHAYVQYYMTSFHESQRNQFVGAKKYQRLLNWSSRRIELSSCPSDDNGGPVEISSSGKKRLSCKVRIFPREHIDVMSTSRSLLQLHRLRFQGPDTLIPDAYNDVCQYGGLYLMHHNEEAGIYKEFIRLCSDIDELDLPATFNAEKEDVLAVIFISFPGYSSSDLHITAKSSNCSQKQIVNVACDKVPFTSSSYETNSKQKFPICFEIWLMYNVNYYSEISEKCRIENDLTDLDEAGILSPVRLHIKNQLFFRTNAHNPHNSHPQYYNFGVTVSALINYPYNEETVQLEESVPTFKPVSMEFGFLNSLTFLTNHSADDLHSSIIRIQLSQNIICGENDERLMLAVPTGSNVYLDVTRRIVGKDYCTMSMTLPHQDTHTSQILGFYYKPTAQDMFRGEVLPYSTVYWGSDIYEAKRPLIKIELKVKANRFSSCNLHVALWEYMRGEFRYHEWHNSTHVNWQVVAGVNGFHFHVNSSCRTSNTNPHPNPSKLLLGITADRDIITHKYAQHDYYMEQFYPIGEQNISEMRYGNWYEALAYCNSIGLTLTTLDSVVTKQLLDLIQTNFEENNIHNLYEGVFAGIFKQENVSFYFMYNNSNV